MGGAAHSGRWMQVSILQRHIPNSFPLPHEVFELGLSHGPLLVYIALVYYKSLRRSADTLISVAIGKLVGLCEKSVRTHLRTLECEGLIQGAISGGKFTCMLCPIRGMVEKRRATDSSRMRKASWRSTQQEWLTGERFNAVFSLPNDVFRLGLKSGELLVYIYLQYQKGAHSDQCWPSYATIGEAVGMSRKTVQKHIGILIDKGLVRADYTSVFAHGQKVNGNLLYTVKPVEQVFREREKALLDKLKQAEAQRKWDERAKRMADTSQA